MRKVSPNGKSQASRPPMGLPGIVTALSTVLAGATLGCGGDATGPLEGVDSIVFLQRAGRGGMGDIFQYNSYLPGARLVRLSPPTADGELTVLCCDQEPMFANADISGYDISFDAREIVLSAKLSEGENYGLFVLALDTGVVEQLATNPDRDYLSPIFLPGDKVMFTTNEVVEAGAPQHVDEYERGETLQLGVMDRAGTNEVLGPRNLSHRTFPTLMSDGRVMVTQWDHLGQMNSGHLMIVNPDMGQLREAFGKQGTGLTNSYFKAVEVAPGRVLAIGSSRDRTVQAGKILDIRLGQVTEQDGVVSADTAKSEANATYRDLTPSVPGDRSPSSSTVGRFYDAFPLNAKDYPDILVSWADGTVESGTLEAAGLIADFGVYLYDARNQTRLPIWNDPEKWDVFARPLRTRTAPPVIAPSSTGGTNQPALIGSMDAYRSSLNTIAPDSVFGVRVWEGYSSEECGIPREFGTVMQEGHALLGVAPLQSDGSWAAEVPPNIPLQLQLVDRFAMTAVNEPVWFSAKPGEQRFCGGCHESRTDTTVIQPGLTEAIALGPVNLKKDVPRAQRQSNTFTRDGVIGVPWDRAIQPILTANCAGCHDGTPSAANPSYQLVDAETNTSVTWTFNLSDDAVNVSIGDLMVTGYSASYVSLLGFDMEDLEDAGITVTGDFKQYIEPFNERTAELFTKLNPPQQYPTADLTQRAFAVQPHLAAVGAPEMSADDYMMLILASAGGGNWYTRENGPACQ